MPLVLRLAAAAVIVLLAGCAGGEAAPEVDLPNSAAPPATSITPSPSDTPSSATPAVSPTSATPSTIAVPATLRFRSTTVDGEAFDGAALAGKPVLLWFWAPWCPTCRSQTDQVQALARDYDGKVSVVGVGSLDDAAAIKAFAGDAPGLTHLSDADGAVFRHFEVVQQSSFVLLDAAGEKVWSVGYGGSDDLADQVAAVAG